MIEYELKVKPHAHLFRVRMRINDPNPQGQILSMPNWIPGSYMIRDYARHIVSIRANVKIKKLSGNAWQCEKTKEPLEIHYEVYANDPSVRGAHLDTTHGFFNGCALFLQAKGKEDEKCHVNLLSPDIPAAKSWQVATALPRGNAPHRGFGEYIAESYDALIDYPVEMGNIAFHEFKANGIPHTLAISGKPLPLPASLLKDLTHICETQQALFEEAPFSEYLFLLRLVKEGYGGLEHRNSTALIASKESVSKANIEQKTALYLDTLALFSHEYFHAWHIKRIKPACFMPYDLDNKTYTEQLWAFEGFTSYYDDLALVRGKVIDEQQYLNMLALSLTRLLRNPGRLIQSVADSSFDAWTKFYQPNENSPNTLVSYYTKGSFIALAIDLSLRLQTNHQTSLDDVMLTLWREYGKPNMGVPEGKIQEILRTLGGESLNNLIEEALYDTKELPLAALFEAFGLTLTLRTAQSVNDRGGMLADNRTITYGMMGCTFIKLKGSVFIANVFNNTPAEEAGLCANDEIIAIDNERVDVSTFDNTLFSFSVGQHIKLHVFRGDELLQITLTLATPFMDTAEIRINEKMTPEQKENLQRWLG